MALMRSMGLSPPVFSLILVEVVHVLLVDGAHSNDHDLNIRTGGEVSYLTKLARVVEEDTRTERSRKGRGSALP